MAIYVKLKMIDVTMKKIYKNPTIKVVKIQPTNILVNSLQTSDENANPELGMSSRRGGSDWDDDDDYDY